MDIASRVQDPAEKPEDAVEEDTKASRQQTLVEVECGGPRSGPGILCPGPVHFR